MYKIEDKLLKDCVRDLKWLISRVESELEHMQDGYSKQDITKALKKPEKTLKQLKEYNL